tara:strand:- start:14610 stop:15041 length:432 start_codon:yes stop_codon:yes gene_type:complete
MKIVGIILAALMLLGSAVVGATGSNKSMDLSAEIGAAAEVLSAEQMEAAGLPSPARLKLGGIVGIIAALGALALLLVTFVQRDKVLLVAGVTMACCILAILLYPGIDTGPTEGMAPRTQAVVALLLAGLGAAGALLAKRASDT